MKMIALENEKLKLRVIPELGGKIASVLVKEKNFDIAAAPGEGREYRKAEEDGNFCAFDMSGIDDAFPNIDEETISYGDRILCYPDHGEIWSREMEVTENRVDKISLRLFSKRFLYEYEKTVILSERGIRLEYRIHSLNDTSLPCFWTLHGLMPYRDNMEFSYPEGTKTFVNVLDDTPLGENGKLFDADDDAMDFSRLPIKSIQGYNKPYYMKYYLQDRVKEGKCSVYYPDEDVRVDFNYPEDKLPWLGVWINGGGFMDGHNVAMEMTNGYYDSVGRALENDRICILKPDDVLSFYVELMIVSGCS